FAPLDLDPRLLRALAKLGFAHPTLVQAKAVPLAMQGRDILARARTGSGKTAAYCMPIVQKILSAKEAVRALILVPTRELAEQVHRHIRDLTLYCSKEISSVNLASADVSLTNQKPILAEKPDIIVATPSKILAHLEAEVRSIFFHSLESLAIDEADLILSYGYDEDVRKTLGFLPKIYQSYLMSATMSSDVDKLKQLVLRNPAILKLEEGKEEEDLLTQYIVKCPENDKFLLTLFILKLRIHPFGTGKCIIFVNDIDRCYRLKLFLEQFGIRACTLNAELPLKSRYHIVQEFNRGIYDFIIATDEGKYGVARGIDFRNVQAVVNFDLPHSARAYMHRVGRTARGVGNRGWALSFVAPR
ncbi:P-loop containing nucleoside triphosphate hydrolase protein, partial [Blyttiomyces helicus]